MSAKHHSLAFPALLLGNVALAFGPWMVRLTDVGPVAAGFWRLGLAVPFLALMSPLAGQPLRLPSRGLLITIIVAAAFFAGDLAAWHAGIRLTKLGNATLFGNISSLIFAAWGFWIARRAPGPVQALALLIAAAGAAILMAGSYELSARHLRGDMLTLFAGLLYAGYLIAVERARATVAPLPLLVIASSAGAVMLLPFSMVLGEQWWPVDWWPLILLALGSQVLGQGLLVYAIGALSPLVVGLALLTQPAISALIGWLAYGETLTSLDWLGAAAVAGALLLVRLPLRRAAPGST